LVSFGIIYIISFFMTIKTLLFPFLSLLSILSFQNAQGQTIRYVKPIASGAATGSSWTNASADLQATILLSTAGDVVWVASGTYYPTRDILNEAIPTDERDKTFSLKEGVALYGGFTGTETSLSQRNWSANTTVLSGDLGTLGDSTDNAYHVVFSNEVTNATIMDGFVVTGGTANGAGATPIGQFVVLKSDGAGMYNAGGAPTLTHVVFSYNTAFNTGGGMYNDYASPSLSNCVFSSNTAFYYGGGLYNFVAAPTLTNCTLFGNAVLINYGNAVYDNISNPILKNCVIWGNTGGGGLYQIYDPSGDFAVVTYSTVENGYPGLGNTNQDPLFVNATLPIGADGKWMTADDGLALQGISPAINGSDPTTTAPTTDITGYTRTGIFDSGAYEFRGPLATITADFTAVTSVKVNPNPTQNSWNFTASNETIQSIQIIDVLGKTILIIAPKNTTATIDASNLTNGIYFAKVTTTTATSTLKLLKK
jgi:hypothetical protein